MLFSAGAAYELATQVKLVEVANEAAYDALATKDPDTLYWVEAS